MQSVSFVASHMPNGRIRARARTCAVNDHLRHGRATVVKLCDMNNRHCLHLSSSLQQYNEMTT
jgi:hypothetical protein